MLLRLNSIRNQSRQKTELASGREREGPGVTSLFLRRQCRWWEISQPCSGSSGNLALGHLGSSSLLSWALCVTLSIGLVQSLQWCLHCKQPPPAQGQVHSGQEGCLLTSGFHWSVEGSAPPQSYSRRLGYSHHLCCCFS